MYNQIKTQPIRMCCACRQHKEKNLLTRFVVKEKDVVIDRSYKEQGRGAYICKDINCFKKARKTKALNRALSININDKLYDDFEKDLFND